MQTIVPYLTVKGASEASAFYQRAFDAKENARHPAEDGKRFMHIALQVHGGDVFLCDEFPEHGGAPAPTKERPAPVQLTIQLKAPKEVDAIYAQAVKAGATGVSEPADMFWGARFAQLRDPFGHLWMLNAQK
ncbi:MAG TPA: VOC family protein [Dongiaceae bacterium]|nr:VOC family protein [Dongiaceae bacterium]